MKILILLFFLDYSTFFHSNITQKLYTTYTNYLHAKQKLLYYQRCSFSGLEVHVRKDRRVMAPNTHRSLLLIRPFVRSILTRAIQEIVMDPNTHRSLLLISHLGRSILACVTRKLPVVLRPFYISNDCSTISEMLISWVRAACEIYTRAKNFSVKINH